MPANDAILAALCPKALLVGGLAPILLPQRLGRDPRLRGNCSSAVVYGSKLLTRAAARTYTPFELRKESYLPPQQQNDELLRGMLDMLVLKALQLGPMHGWGITERLEQGSRNALRVGQGSLYPALYRLEDKGLISSSWGASDNNRKARFYALTAKGRAHLAEERQAWKRLSRAVELILAMD